MGLKALRIIETGAVKIAERAYETRLNKLCSVGFGIKPQPIGDVVEIMGRKSCENQFIKRTFNSIEEELKFLKETYEKERIKFFEIHKNNTPSEEERFRAFLPLMRRQYGCNYNSIAQEAKFYAKDPNNWLAYIFNKTPIANELALKITLKQMSPENLELYNNAKKVFESRKLKYNELDLAQSIFHPNDKELIESVARGEFSFWGEVLGHGQAYRVNDALRMGANVDDTLRVILDEGFRTVEPLEETRLVYRAVQGGKADNSLDFINKLVNAKEGDVFVDKGYSYSSFVENCARPCNSISDFSTPWAKLNIIVPKGARVSDGRDYAQRELLFPRNAEFKVIEKPELKYPAGEHCKGEDGYEILLEYILPKA